MLVDKNQPYKSKETELIKACQRHDRLAQSEFFKLYSSKFLGVAYRFAGDFDIANDLLQEGFIRIFNNIQHYQFQGSFEGWMRRIIINTSINYLKKHYKIGFETVDYSEAVLEHTADASGPSVLQDMECEEIIHLVNTLPPGFRTILNLYAIEGYSYHEIALLLEVKEVTVRSQYLRAKQRLAQLLEKKNKTAYATKIV